MDRCRIIVLFLVSVTISISFARISTRCYMCRSRGDNGDCRDPFTFNGTTIKDLPGNPITFTPCPSGWCRKQTEGVRGPADEYGSATERSCLAQAPNDGEERCVEVKIRNRVSLLCVCKGDFCNSSVSLYPTHLVPLITLVLSLAYFFQSSNFLDS